MIYYSIGENELLILQIEENEYNKINKEIAVCFENEHNELVEDMAAIRRFEEMQRYYEESLDF